MFCVLNVVTACRRRDHTNNARLSRSASSPEQPASGRTRDGLSYPLDLLYERAGVDSSARQANRGGSHSRAVQRSARPSERDDVDPRRPLRRANGRSSAFELLEAPLVFPACAARAERDGTAGGDGRGANPAGCFSPAVRARILGQRTPLGRILSEEGLAFHSCPKAFLQVEPNAEMMGVFWMPATQSLYGRRTELTLDGDRIGDIVEILPLV